MLKVRKFLTKFKKSKFVEVVLKTLFFAMSKLPTQKNTIVFESFLGKQYSDNPRALYEYMQENYSQYNLVWSADRRYLKVFEQHNIKHVRRLSIRWLFLMGRAKYWIVNSRLPLWIPKPKNTIYIQTWHGTPLKRLGVDIEEVRMPGVNTKKYKKDFLFESNKWDYLISPNNYSTDIFQRAFGFEKIIIESGYPRNDYLINNNEKESILSLKKKMNVPLDKKVILYAPTWRDNQFRGQGSYTFDLQMDLKRMNDKLGDKFIIILRLHYLVAEKLDLTGFKGFVYEFSYYEDIRDLYLIADMLITDYSSVFFDFAILKRPILFFVYDIEDYRDNIRGFYFDFEKKAPGPLVKTTEEVINKIMEIENEGFRPSETLESFYNRFCYLEDGNASERVVKKVFTK